MIGNLTRRSFVVGAVFVGGNRMIRTAADYGIEGDDAAAVDWFLSSGVTNAGDTLTEFGDKMYGFEYAVALYRLFQIVCDQVTFAKGYVDAYQARFNGPLAFKLYGESTIATPDGTLGATVADGATLTVYGQIVDETGAAVELPARCSSRATSTARSPW